MAENITWTLDNILEGKTIELAVNDLVEKVRHFCSKREQLDAFEAKDVLLALKEKEEILVLKSKLGAYLGLQFSENTQDTAVLAEMTRLENIMSDLGNEMIFFPLWLMHLSDEKAKDVLFSDVTSDYHYYLHEIRKEKPYTKDEATEKIISIKSLTGGGSTDNLYSIFTNAFSFSFNGKDGLSREEVVRHVQGQDPELREKAYQTVLGKYGKESTLLSEMYKNIVLDWVNEAIKIRGYKDSISVRNTSNDISDKAVDALLSVVRENVDIFISYQELKYEINKKKGADYPFSRYHLYAPLLSDTTKEYSFEESKEIVLSTYKQFSEEFYTAAKKIFDENHVHAFPQPNKRGGAFCYSIHNKETPFILLNHTGTLRDLFTMMHEFGHGIHGVLACEQNNLNYDTAIPMAETASIFGEMMLGDRLLKEVSDAEEKKEILMHLLDDQYASIVRQAYFVLFEKYAHEKIPQGITKDELDLSYMDFLREQFGKKMDLPGDFAHEWNYIPHIHASPFYCYAYTWGNLLVLALYQMYKEEGESFVGKYRTLLSSGGCASPAELLSALDVDPEDKTFWQKGFDIIREEVKELRELTE